MHYNRKTSKQCLECPMSHEGINGRFCNIIKMYVEHNTTPPCR